MYTSSNVALRIKAVAKSKGAAIKDILTTCGLSKNTLSSMLSRGSWLQSNSLAKIADCLDCSVDYLLGRTESETMPKTPVETETIEYYLKLDSLAKTEIDNAVRKLMTEQNKTE